jgi:ionotropic glutamate receptor
LQLGFYINIQRSSYRLLVGFWLLAATVLVNSYSGTLVSSLTMTKLKPTVNSLEDLAASSDLTMTVNVNSIVAQTIMVGYGLMHI